MMIEPEEDLTELELDDEENHHDQLPSVEEVKTNVPTSQRRRFKVLLLAGVAGVAVMTAMIIAFSVAASKSSSSTSSSSARLRDTQKILANYVNDTSLSTPGTPQYQAAAWMADVDPLKVEPSNYGNFLQRYALAVIYFATGGDSWTTTNSVKFLSGREECSWYAISQEAGQVGVTCSKSNVVEKLVLLNQGLSGTIPPEINLLKQLTVLSLDGNSLTGTLPETLQEMSKLETLSVANNTLEQPIPDFIGKLTRLQFLRLSNNAFFQSIPSSLAKLTALKTLALDTNAIEGDLKVLDSMKTLQHLYLDGNMILDNISRTNFLSNLTSLISLDLSGNSLSGHVSRALFRFPKLEILDLHDNMLKGTIDSSIPNSTSLRFLALNYNNLGGTIPSSIGNLVGLEHLDISQNQFHGTFPTSIGSLTNLTFLFLSGSKNSTSGTIPDFIQNMTNLRELSLKSTARTGTIPSWIGTKLSSLKLLDLDNNHLHGTVPTTLGSLKDLMFLLINRNQLNGTIPTELLKLSNLEMILMNKNSFTNNEGHTNHLCNWTVPHLYVDCKSCGANCCENCCNGDTCYEEDDLLADYDPSWENGYLRDDYNFSTSWVFNTTRTR